MYTNAQSLKHNLDSFNEYCKVKNPLIICMSETHVVPDINSSELIIDGYDLVRCDSDSCHTGGVAIYIKKNIKFSIVAKKFISRTWILTIRVVFEKTLDISVVYKSPREKHNKFFEIFDEYIVNNLNYNNDNIIVGDINLNMAIITSSVKNYLNLLREHNFRQIIREPTRPNRQNLNASTIIDHVLINNSKVSYKINKEDQISDHYIIELEFNSMRYLKTSEKKRKMIKNYKKSIFMNDLLTNVHENCSFENFYNTLKNTMNKFVKFVDIKRKKFKFNRSIEELKRNKCKAYNKYAASHCINDYNNYMKLKKQFKKELKNLNLLSWQKSLDMHRHNPKFIWQNLKSLYSQKNNEIKAINFDGLIVDNEKEIGNKLNASFVNSVVDIVNSIELPDKSSYLQYIITPIEQFEICRISMCELHQYIKIIKSKTFDDFVYGENIADLSQNEKLSNILLKAVNDTLISSTIPKSMKVSIVSPVPKIENPEKPEDFRPINNLSVLEKLLENIVLDQLKVFLSSNNILASAQHGFRAGHSTETALITLVDNIICKHECKKMALTVFLDFKRAFETIDRKILIKKLKRYNFSPNAVNWFEDFLSGRKQIVKINGVYSEEVEVGLGVPQGSMIANVLFILYINDLVQILSQCDVIMYADDTSITVYGDSYDEMSEKMNEILVNVSDWLKFNRIALNAAKSNYMIFDNKPRSKNKKDIDIIIDGVKIQKVTQVKYLGVILDENLNFNANGDYVVKKLNKKLGFLRRQGGKMNEFCRTLYYKSLVQPHIDYCSFILNMMDKGILDKIQKLQNKFIKAIKMKKEISNYETVLSELKIVKVNKRININIMKTINRVIINDMPKEISSRFQTNSNVRQRTLRFGNKYKLPYYFTKIGQKSFFFDGVKKFNELNEFVVKHKLESNNFIENCMKFY
jgi:Reverse transcriptase (RNA-dependent DNA polymerase)